MLALTATSANRIWAKAFQALSQRDSLPTRPSRVGETFEMLHCVAEITDPRQRWVTVRKPAMNVAFAIVEVIGILNGRQDTEYLIYFNRSLPQYAGAERKYSTVPTDTAYDMLLALINFNVRSTSLYTTKPVDRSCFKSGTPQLTFHQKMESRELKISRATSPPC